MKTILSRVLFLCLFFAAGRVLAVDRLVTISAPSEARPGTQVRVVVQASTDAVDGEQIGFFHSEYSVDGGKTWVGICYEEKSGAAIERTTTFPAGEAGSKIVVRAKAAFRGGKAGDVDFKGAPIKWDDTWGAWRTPPTKFALIYVR